MSYQSEYYRKHADEINHKRRLAYKAKTIAKTKAKNRFSMSSEPHIPSPAQQPPLQEASKLELRLHRLQRTYSIENAVSEERLRALRLNDRLNNTKQWLGTGFRVIRGDGWTLELEGVELTCDSRLDVAVVMGVAYTLTDHVAHSIAEEYGFFIAKEGHTPPRLTEIELSATQVTERLKGIQKKGVIEIFTDLEGYKIWLDWSWGVGGPESNKMLYLERIKSWARDLAINDGWEQMKANLLEASGLIKYFALSGSLANPEAREALRLLVTLLKELSHDREKDRQPE